MICDEVCCNSISVANPLSNDDVNPSNVLNLSLILAEVISKLFNLLPSDELKLDIDATLPLNVVAIEELIEDDINVCDADNEELTIETSISVAITDKELLNDELTVLIIDWEIDELNDVKFKLWVANVCATDALKSPLTLWTDALNKLKLVLTDELKFVTDNKLPLKVDAIDELIEDDIKICDAEIDELTTATSKSVAKSLYPIVPLMYIWDEPETTPSGKAAPTLFVIILIIEAESDDCKDCDIVLFIASAKLPPDSLIALPALIAASNCALPSICFNLIKFAISYKYLLLF